MIPNSVTEAKLWVKRLCPFYTPEPDIKAAVEKIGFALSFIVSLFDRVPLLF